MDDQQVAQQANINGQEQITLRKKARVILLIAALTVPFVIPLYLSLFSALAISSLFNVSPSAFFSILLFIPAIGELLLVIWGVRLLKKSFFGLDQIAQKQFVRKEWAVQLIGLVMGVLLVVTAQAAYTSYKTSKHSGPFSFSQFQFVLSDFYMENSHYPTDLTETLSLNSAVGFGEGALSVDKVTYKASADRLTYTLCSKIGEKPCATQATNALQRDINRRQDIVIFLQSVDDYFKLMGKYPDIDTKTGFTTDLKFDYHKMSKIKDSEITYSLTADATNFSACFRFEAKPTECYDKEILSQAGLNKVFEMPTSWK